MRSPEAGVELALGVVGADHEERCAQRASPNQRRAARVVDSESVLGQKTNAIQGFSKAVLKPNDALMLLALDHEALQVVLLQVVQRLLVVVLFPGLEERVPPALVGAHSQVCDASRAVAPFEADQKLVILESELFFPNFPQMIEFSNQPGVTLQAKSRSVRSFGRRQWGGGLDSPLVDLRLRSLHQ